jgi:hypothetical protein
MKTIDWSFYLLLYSSFIIAGQGLAVGLWLFSFLYEDGPISLGGWALFALAASFAMSVICSVFGKSYPEPD